MFKMPKFVADLSEDDDEVVVVPYVKPPPPMIVLSESEDDVESAPVQDESNVPLPKTKENVSRSTSSRGQRVRRDGSSRAEGGSGIGSRSKRKEKDKTSQNENNMPNQLPTPTNLFHPSETAIMDTSRTSTPTRSVDGSPVPSPSSSSTAEVKKGKGSHSTLVKEQFASFLKGINLPPPPPRGRPAKTPTTEETTGTTEETAVDPEPTSSTPLPVQKKVQGFVSVTPEKSKRCTKDKCVEKIRKTRAAGSKQGCQSSEKRKTAMNLQYNLTTTPFNLSPEKTKSKGTKRTKKATEAEPGTKVTKKRKKDGSSTPRSTEKETPKRRERTTKQNATKDKEIPDIPAFQLNHPGFPTHWTDGMKQFYGTIDKKDFKLNSILSKQPADSRYWRLSEHRAPRKRRREACEICKKWDHWSVNCPQRGLPTRCVYCASSSHIKDACPVGYCLFCGTRQDWVTKTCRNCLDWRGRKPIPCTMCEVVGHDKDSCPDNWRKYHSITFTNNVELMEQDLRALKVKRGRRVADKNLLTREAERLHTSHHSRALEKVGKDVSNLDEEIKELEEKIKQEMESQVVNPEVHPYTPKYQQYCCNCASKGHNYINCKMDRPQWTPKHRIIPNKPYLTIKKSVAPLDITVPSPVASTSTTGREAVKSSIPSQKENKGGRRVVFDTAEEEAGSATVTITNEAQPKEPPLVEKECPPPKKVPVSAAREEPLPSQLLLADQQENQARPVPPPPVMERSRADSQFYEDDLPASFDARPPPPPVGIGVVSPSIFGFPPRMPFPPPMTHPIPTPLFNVPPPLFNVPPPLFNVPPPPVWRDGSGRIQYPPPGGYPVPVLVREKDYARFQREGFPAQFQFSEFYQPMSNMFPHQQIPPTQFAQTSSNPFQQKASEMSTHASELLSQAPEDHGPKTSRTENPPSPDSTENLPKSPPPTSRGGSPEIEFLGEVHKEKFTSNPTSAPVPAKPAPSAKPTEDAHASPDQRRNRDDTRSRNYNRDYDGDRRYRNNWNSDPRDGRRYHGGYYRDARRAPYEYHLDSNYREDNRGGYGYDQPRGYGTNGPPPAPPPRPPKGPYLPHHHSRRARRYFDAR